MTKVLSPFMPSGAFPVVDVAHVSNAVATTDPRLGIRVQGYNSAALQSAIDYCRSHGISTVTIPNGLTIDAPINITTAPGYYPVPIRLRGEGPYSFVNVNARIGIEFTGTWQCVLEDLYFRHLAETNLPECVLLFARNASNVGAGQHLLRNVSIEARCSKALVIGISSEVLTFDHCMLSTAGEPWLMTLTSQNELEIEPEYGVFPETFAGGNTVHHVIGGSYIGPYGVDGSDSPNGGIWIRESEGISFSATPFFNSKAASGIRIENCAGVSLNGVRAEWFGGAQVGDVYEGGGVVFDGTVESVAVHGCSLTRSFYGRDGSTVKGLQVRASKLPGYPGNLYDAETISIDSPTNGNGFIVRHSAIGLSSVENVSSPAVFLPSTGGNNDQRYRRIEGGDHYFRKISDGTRDMLLTRAHGVTTRLQRPQVIPWQASTPILPDPDLGSTIIVTGINGAQHIGNLNPSVWNPNPALPDHPLAGEITFIFQNHASGGGSITWDAQFAVDPAWTPSTAGSKVNTATFVYSYALGRAVQTAGKVGL